ncbi:MAG TPA: histidine kinase [Bryobacteraceae bacterium]|nr:histidine kinase [Bryobacteraceae bacterium]
MEDRRSPTIRLLAGLAVTLSAVAVYSGFTFVQLRGLERLQTTAIDRNRLDSLLLLRIQGNLNQIALTMRDMLDNSEPYPMSAWRAQFHRIRTDLADALDQEAKYSPGPAGGAAEVDQRAQISSNVAQFWDALDRVFALAEHGDEAKARDFIRLSLQEREDTLSAAVARLLRANNEAEQEASARVRDIYAGVRHSAYWFLAAMAIAIVLTSLYLVHYIRGMFERVAALSERRSELAQQLISMQENTFRSISRELHDEFGQILTAIGAMLQRTSRRDFSGDERARTELREIQEVVQTTLEKVRTLSHALHPVALEEAGFESAMDAYLPRFEKQTGIAIQCEKDGVSREVDHGLAIHLYRVMQEALNNVARHSKSASASVRLRFLPESVVLEVADRGVGFGNRKQQGMGLVSMRERAEMVNGRVEFLDREGGGAIVRMTAPTSAE